jgi:hypothetical protein
LPTVLPFVVVDCGSGFIFDVADDFSIPLLLPPFALVVVVFFTPLTLCVVDAPMEVMILLVDLAAMRDEKIHRKKRGWFFVVGGH